MLNLIRPALVLFGGLTIITGVVYPLVVTAIANVAFNDKAAGSVVMRDGSAVGSSLIAQPFTEPGYFWPRPSAANYDSAAASGSNVGPSNPAIAEAVASRVAKLNAPAAKVPLDLVTTSGSGLDPHISPEAARFQAARVAQSRGIAESEVMRTIDENLDGRLLGVFGEPRVNVLQLNLALDHARPTATTRATTRATTGSAIGWKAHGFEPAVH